MNCKGCDQPLAYVGAQCSYCPPPAGKPVAATAKPKEPKWWGINPWSHDAARAISIHFGWNTSAYDVTLNRQR